jgi:hypothetical protein
MSSLNTWAGPSASAATCSRRSARTPTFSNTRRAPPSVPIALRTARKAAASFLRFSISPATMGQNVRSVAGWGSFPSYGRRCAPFSPSSAALSSSSWSVVSSSSPKSWLRWQVQRQSVSLCRCSPLRLSGYAHEEIRLGPDDAVDWRTRRRADRADRERLRHRSQLAVVTRRPTLAGPGPSHARGKTVSASVFLRLDRISAATDGDDRLDLAGEAGGARLD